MGYAIFVAVLVGLMAIPIYIYLAANYNERHKDD